MQTMQIQQPSLKYLLQWVAHTKYLLGSAKMQLPHRRTILASPARQLSSCFFITPEQMQNQKKVPDSFNAPRRPLGSELTPGSEGTSKNDRTHDRTHNAPQKRLGGVLVAHIAGARLIARFGAQNIVL
jgi:hypothetical protein